MKDGSGDSMQHSIIEVTKENYDEFKNLDKISQGSYIQNLINNHRLVHSIGNSDNFNKQATNKADNDKDLHQNQIYIASMLLQFAVLDNNIDIIELLLKDYKADPIAENYIHSTAISLAISKNNIDALKTFVHLHDEKVCKKEISEDMAHGPLSWAVASTELNLDQVEMYLEKFYNNVQLLGIDTSVHA